MDSLNEAIEYYCNGKKYNDERCYKFCILLLSHCAELCLKEILVKRHKVFLYEDVDNVKEDDEQKTIGYMLALKRVKNICEVNMGAYYTYLEDLARIRNRIQHYKFSISKEHSLKIITSALSAIEYIVHSVLGKRFNDFEDIISYEQIEILRNDMSAFAKRKQDINKEIKSSGAKRLGIEYREGKFFLIPCPYCYEEFLVCEKEEIICKLCNSNFESAKDVYEKDSDCAISTAMKRKIGRKRDLFLDIYECEACNNETLVYVANKEESPSCAYSQEKWQCLSCGNIVASESCNDCEEPMPYSEYYYTFAQSYTATEKYLFLCKKCGRKLRDSEYGVEYEIR